MSTLQASGKFRTVSAQADTLPTTVDQRKRAYEGACQRQRVDLVLSGVDDGETVNSNMLSFKRGAVTRKITLEGYGCAAHSLIWGDAMAIIVESGRQATPQSEIDGAAGQAWGERILQARAS